MSAVLSLRDVSIALPTGADRPYAAEHISFDVNAGEIVCLLGESGSGKSVISFSVMGLLPDNVQVASGEILLDGVNLLKLSRDQLRAIRGDDVAMIFQEPMTSLNPVYTVGEQIAEVVRLHDKSSRRAAMERATEMLRLVNIPNPQKRVNDYPHQFSGGMRQRVMIAMALSCNPKLLIADEPTTALDVTIQAQILDLMNELKEKLGMSIMLITHAMGVVAETAQRVVVMYAGKVIEEANVVDLFRTPLHPYTQGLIRSIPRIDLAATHKQRLEAIGGSVPKLINPAPGCRFASRCAHVRAECKAATPPLIEVSSGHKVACVLHAA